jgi:hypothetical protein
LRTDPESIRELFADEKEAEAERARREKVRKKWIDVVGKAKKLQGAEMELTADPRKEEATETIRVRMRRGREGSR